MLSVKILEYYINLMQFNNIYFVVIVSKDHPMRRPQQRTVANSNNERLRISFRPTLESLSGIRFGSRINSPLSSRTTRTSILQRVTIKAQAMDTHMVAMIESILTNFDLPFGADPSDSILFVFCLSSTREELFPAGCTVLGKVLHCQILCTEVCWTYLVHH